MSYVKEAIRKARAGVFIDRFFGNEDLMEHVEMILSPNGKKILRHFLRKLNPEEQLSQMCSRYEQALGSMYYFPLYENENFFLCMLMLRSLVKMKEEHFRKIVSPSVQACFERWRQQVISGEISICVKSESLEYKPRKISSAIKQGWFLE